MPQPIPEVTLREPKWHERGRVSNAIVNVTIDMGDEDVLTLVPILADEDGIAGLRFDMGDEFQLAVSLPMRAQAIELVNAVLAAARSCDGPVPDDDTEWLRVQYDAVSETQRVVNTFVDELRACLQAHSHGQGANSSDDSEHCDLRDRVREGRP